MDIELITKTVNDAYKNGYLRKIYESHAAGYCEEQYKEFYSFYSGVGIFFGMVCLRKQTI